MVAPVNVVWNFPTYKNPLHSTFTGTSIQIDIPPNFGEFAGFHLGTTAVPTKTDERFRLTRLDIRKPAVAYSGLGQALSHVMEMVLILKQENGDYWANVILPFQVSTNGADMDIINPIIGGTTLPNRTGQTGYVMASAVSELKLSPGFDNATFSEFWGTAPAYGCPNKTVNVRYFMRTTTLAIGVDTFAQLSGALENAPLQDPTQPSETTWIVNTCKNNTGNCVIQKAADLAKKLKDAQSYVSQAVTKQRARKIDLDTALKDLKNHTGGATNQSIALFNTASAAMTDLKAAASELISAEANTAKVQTFASEAAGAKWDQNQPKTKAILAQLAQLHESQLDSHTLASLAGINEQQADASPSPASITESLFGSLVPSRFRGKRHVSV